MKVVGLDIDRIIILQARNCMEVREMLERADINPTTWRGIKKRGTAKPQTAGKLAKALGVDVTEIIKA